MPHPISRRSFLGGSTSVLGTALLSRHSFAYPLVVQTQTAALASETAKRFDGFARDYMRVMHAPGMTVGLTSEAYSSARVFGYSNLEARVPVSAEQPFWIGSICKSFVGLIAMQLRDEGKLDLHKPVLEIMPDLPFRNGFGPITAHHLLTHTSGLPNWLQLIGTDSTQWASQAYKPGERFAYCNLGYDTLGLLIAHLDGRSWPEAVTARILKPLAMGGASGQIDDATQARMPIGYHFQYRDRPSTIVDSMVAVGYVLMDNAAGSIAATADDMTKYMRMLVQRGKGPAGRILSEEGFRLFSTPYIKAAVLSPGASYGYGIGVETVDGRTMLRHTGGATAFASSILVDLDGGVGCFASINSMQEYRPNPVTKFGVDLLYAEKTKKGLPASPYLEDPMECKDPQDYVGTYKAVSGDVLTVTVEGKTVMLISAQGKTTLRPIAPSAFSAADGTVLRDSGKARVPSEFALVFGRGEPKNGAKASVIELSYGSQWYANENYKGPHEFAHMQRAERYVGIYCIDSPWLSPLRVLERNGKLWLDGTAELHSSGTDRFSVEGDEGTLELEFVSFVDGRAQAVRTMGEVLRRVNLGPAI